MLGKIKGIRYGEVISIADDVDTDAIQVKIIPEDNSKLPSGIPYAFPLLPKMLHIKPKKGEGVLVVLTYTNDGNSQRYYIGPLISQDHKIGFDPFLGGSDAFMNGSLIGLDKAPSMDPKKDGTMPNNNDIMLRGRGYSDIQITDEDIRIRSGVKKLTNDGSDFEFNSVDPAYIKVKYHPNGLAAEEDDRTGPEVNSTATIVADKIFLLSHKPKERTKHFEVTDENELVKDEELKAALREDGAYTIPYGEKLVDLLNTLIEAFIAHTHAFPMEPPVPTHYEELMRKKTEYLDGKKMLSDTIRFN